MTPNPFLRRRAGFTLVELMTVLFVIAALAAITVTIARSQVADSYKTVGGADRLSGWLLIAKNRALRDRVPVGIRLIRDLNNPYVAREAQFVEMPVLWAPNQNPDGFALGMANPRSPFVVVKYDQGAGGLRQEDGIPSAASNYGVFVFGIDVTAFDVKVGDLLRLADLGTLHRIEGITALTQAPAWYPAGSPANLYPPIGAGFPAFKLTLAQSVIPLRANEKYPPSPPNPPMLLPFGTGAAPAANSQTTVYPANYPPIGAANFYRTFFFGFFRAARPILGEPLVTLPTEMVVDMTPDRLEGANPYPVYRNPSFGIATMNPFPAPLPANGPPPAGLPDVDIIFAPSGQVMFTDSGMVCLWLRNESKPAGNLPLGGTPLREIQQETATQRFFDRARMLAGGESVIVAVYTKSGAISSYPVFMPDPATNAYDKTFRQDMYKFVRDAFNRGL